MNYFVVDTSFQMLSAIEAREALAHGQKNCLIVEARGASEGRALNINQILALDDGGWHSIDVSYFPRRKGAWRSIKRFANLIKVRIRRGRGEVCFIATLSEVWARRIMRILGGTKIVRLDDGTGSIPSVWRLRKASPSGSASTRAFTMFYHSGDPEGIYPNRFEVLRRCAAEAVINSSLVWIVGGAYSESQTLSLEREMKAIDFLRRKNSGAKCLYLPHRADLPQKLDAIRGIGIEISEIGPTFERRLLDEPYCPFRICGVSSTALLTSRLIRPEIEVIALELTPPPSDTYQAIYAEARAMGVTLIPEV